MKKWPIKYNPNKALLDFPLTAYAFSGKNIRSHAAQNPQNSLSFQKVAMPPFYRLSIIIPRQVFDKGYPVNPKNFGERLRKARMDAGMQIKELAGILGVTPDTVINWELRGMKPMGQNLNKASHFLRGRALN